MSEGLLTEEEVKNYLDVDAPAVKDLVRKKKLTAYQIGDSYVRYRKDQVIAVRTGTRFKLPEELDRNWFDKSRDFVNFYGLYFFFGTLIIALIVILIQP